MRVQSTVLALAAVAFFPRPLAIAQQLITTGQAPHPARRRAAQCRHRRRRIADRQARQRRGGDRDPRSLAVHRPARIDRHPCFHIGAISQGRAASPMPARRRPMRRWRPPRTPHAMLMAGFTHMSEHRQPIDVPLRDALRADRLLGRGSSPRSTSSPIPSSRPTRCGSSCANRSPTAPTSSRFSLRKASARRRPDTERRADPAPAAKRRHWKTPSGCMPMRRPRLRCRACGCTAVAHGRRSPTPKLT